MKSLSNDLSAGAARYGKGIGRVQSLLCEQRKNTAAGIDAWGLRRSYREQAYADLIGRSDNFSCRLYMQWIKWRLYMVYLQQEVHR